MWLKGHMKTYLVKKKSPVHPSVQVEKNRLAFVVMDNEMLIIWIVCLHAHHS